MSHTEESETKLSHHSLYGDKGQEVLHKRYVAPSNSSQDGDGPSHQRLWVPWQRI